MAKIPFKDSSYQLELKTYVFGFGKNSGKTFKEVWETNPSYIDCCYILHEKVSARHKDLLGMPNWTKEELAELSKSLRRKTKLALHKKEIHIDRLDQLLKNAQSPMTYDEINDIVKYAELYT